MYVRFVSALRRVVKFGSVHNRQLSTTASETHKMDEECRVIIDGVKLNYARFGYGEHSVLLLPGALGTIWTDFRLQMERMDTKKMALVSWDPPGYGKSRPPERVFPIDFFQRDAKLVHKLMEYLGRSEKYSLIGWSDGGITALLLASMYPDNIRKMVVFGANAYIHPDEMKLYESIRDINKWSKGMRAPMMQVYGKDYFQKTWSGWVDGVKKLYESQNGNICKEVLPKIKCPTLIIHGAKDAMVLPEHPQYLKENIANSKLHIFENGGHNLHIRYPDEFNKLVTDFLLNESKI